MTRQPYLLGLDIGTTNLKAVLVATDGRIIRVATCPTPTRQEEDGRAVHEADALWAAICRVTREVTAEIEGRVEGVAVASMGEEGFPLDGNLQPLYPGIAWYDARTTPQAERWQELDDPDRVYQICGLLPQHTYTVHKLAWLRENEPQVWQRMRRWSSVSDFVALRLSGALRMDLSQASRTSLLNLRGHRWSPDLLHLGDVPENLLPELVQSGTKVGTVTLEAARETGLQGGIPVAAGGHDHLCGALAAGAVEPGAMLHSGGTAEGVFAPLESPTMTPAAREAGLSFGCHVAPGRYYVEGGIRSGEAIRWARAILAPGENSYDGLATAAENSPPGARGVLFVPPHLYGPGPQVGGAFLGLRPHHTRSDLARAVFEGISYASRRVADTVVEHAGTSPKSVTAIGGLTRIRLWCQLKAALLDLPVMLTATPEAVAQGAAALAGLAAGVYADAGASVAAMAQIADTIRPEPGAVALYEGLYRAWLAVDDRYAGVFQPGG